jgi:hypothetical protein
VTPRPRRSEPEVVWSEMSRAMRRPCRSSRVLRRQAGVAAPRRVLRLRLLRLHGLGCRRARRVRVSLPGSLLDRTGPASLLHPRRRSPRRVCARPSGAPHDMAEFFVMRKYRRGASGPTPHAWCSSASRAPGRYAR